MKNVIYISLNREFRFANIMNDIKYETINNIQYYTQKFG